MRIPSPKAYIIAARWINFSLHSTNQTPGNNLFILSRFNFETHRLTHHISLTGDVSLPLFLSLEIFILQFYKSLTALLLTSTQVFWAGWEKQFSVFRVYITYNSALRPSSFFAKRFLSRAFGTENPFSFKIYILVSRRKIWPISSHSLIIHPLVALALSWREFGEETQYEVTKIKSSFRQNIIIFRFIYLNIPSNVVVLLDSIWFDLIFFAF